MFRKMPLTLLATIILLLLLGKIIPLPIKEALYAISLTIKSFIILILPVIVFSLLFNTMVGLARRATAIIALILLLVCVSNVTSSFLSHFVGQWVYHFDLAISFPLEKEQLQPAWVWQFPKIIANDKAMFAGIGLGILLSWLRPTWGQAIAIQLEKVITQILRGFIFLIPPFIAGFIIKLEFDGTIGTLIKHYSTILLVVATAQFSYIVLAYGLLNQFNLAKWSRAIKNMLPAAIAGFSTMSSAAAMPLTIAGAENNAKNKDLAGSVIPATVNIHLVGDCFAIPIFAYAIMKSFGVAEPSLWVYLGFIFYFVLAKFSVAAVPGGGIIVMLPILESQLGFNANMLSLITALYILFDPIITCANVLGNGAFSKLIDVIAQPLDGNG